MLSSLLKIELLLKCDVCLSTLRQSRIVAECGHRFCLDCIKEKLSTSEICPTCELPATLEDLLKDPMHDNLVSYVTKLKTALLSHALTPLEDSLMNKRELINTQESEDLEEEYRDLPAAKKFKKSDSLTDMTERPVRQRNTPIYVVMSDDEDMMDAGEPSIVGAAYQPVEVTDIPGVPDETVTTSDVWQCSECEFTNKACIQTCGVCKKFKNRNTSVVARKGKSKASDIALYSVTSSSRPGRSNTLADQTLDSATLARPSVPKKNVYIIFTAVTPEEMDVIDRQIEHVSESKLQINIVTELKDIKKVTHVVSSVDRKKQCHRTLKYLSGIVSGKWIVTTKWLLDSMKSKKWLDEDNYEVQGDAKSGLTHAPRKGRNRQGGGLFQGMNFFFAGEFSETHNRKDLSLLIRQAGGQVESRKPTSCGNKDSFDRLDVSQPIIIYSKSNTGKKMKWLNEYQVRDPTWIIDSISQLEINK